MRTWMLAPALLAVCSTVMVPNRQPAVKAVLDERPLNVPTVAYLQDRDLPEIPPSPNSKRKEQPEPSGDTKIETDKAPVPQQDEPSPEPATEPKPAEGPARDDSQQTKAASEEPPVAEPPVAEPPVAEPPVAEPPVAEPPVAEPPVAEPPVAEPPVSEPPVAEPPVAEPPVAEPPVAEPPVAEPPVAEPPVAEPPVAEPPVAEPPVAEPPVAEPPVAEPPVAEPPVAEPPVAEPPVSEPPVAEPPVAEPPVAEPPATVTPVTEPELVKPVTEAVQQTGGETVDETAVETAHSETETVDDGLPVITPGPSTGKSYRAIYESIPFSRSEYEANPSYRHDATMEILFGKQRPMTIHRYQQQPERDSRQTHELNPGRTRLRFGLYYAPNYPGRRYYRW